MVTIEEAKQQAKILKEYLKQNNEGISHSSCLHAVAKMHHFNDWNAMLAALKDNNEK